MTKENIVEKLELLNNFFELSVDEIDTQEETLKYPPLNHYLKSSKHGSKPKTASAKLLTKLTDDVLNKSAFWEMKLPLGYIDFAIPKNKLNPLMIELKPAFDRDGG